MKRILPVMAFLFVLGASVLPGAAQEDAVSPPDLLVTALDENGVEQIYRIDVMSGDVEQVSNAKFSVEAFDLTENVLAYVSGDILYIEHPDSKIAQPLHRPQELLVTVHISQDEREVSYNDDSGLYILNIDSSKTERLLVHKDFTNPNNPNGVGDGRYYYEAVFVEASDKLLIGVRLWEGRTLGVYNRTTQTLTELLVGWTDPDVELQVFNRILLLDDGQVLLHDNDGRGCFPCGLWRAPSLDEILENEQILENEDLTLGERGDLIAPGMPTMNQGADGMVQLFVQFGILDEDEMLQDKRLVLTLDPETEMLTPNTLEFDEDIAPVQPQFSPDGNYLTFIGTPRREPYEPTGSPVVYDLETGTKLPLDVPLEISSIRWAQ